MSDLRKNKRGQTEDIFADLVPALIILVIALLVLAKVNADNKSWVTTQISNSKAKIDRMSSVIFLKTPFYEDMSFMEFINGLEYYDDSKIKEFENKKLLTKEYISSFAGKGYTYSCGEEMNKFISETLGMSYKAWVVTMYSSKNEIMFHCADSKDSFRITGMDGKMAVQPYDDSPVGIAQIKLPTKDPSKENIVQIFYAVEV